MASNVTQSIHLDWIRCGFCIRTFTRNVKFYFLSCKKITCVDCAKKMRSQTHPNKIDCSICKATVNLCSISEKMPANIRDMFKNPFELSKEVVKISTFQASLRNEATLNQFVKMKRTKDAITKFLYGKKEYEKGVERSRRYIAQLREQILKVILLEHLDRLLTLSEENLKNMKIENLICRRRRSPRDGTSSRSSHHSRHSRSSSKHHSTSENISDQSTLNRQYQQSLQLNSPNPARGMQNFGYHESRPVLHSRADPLRRRSSHHRRRRYSRDIAPENEARPGHYSRADPSHRRTSRDHDRRHSREIAPEKETRPGHDPARQRLSRDEERGNSRESRNTHYRHRDQPPGNYCPL